MEYKIKEKDVVLTAMERDNLFNDLAIDMVVEKVSDIIDAEYGKKYSAKKCKELAEEALYLIGKNEEISNAVYSDIKQTIKEDIY